MATFLRHALGINQPNKQTLPCWENSSSLKRIHPKIFINRPAYRYILIYYPTTSHKMQISTPAVLREPTNLRLWSLSHPQFISRACPSKGGKFYLKLTPPTILQLKPCLRLELVTLLILIVGFIMKVE